jgi:hypothetical protein
VPPPLIFDEESLQTVATSGHLRNIESSAWAASITPICLFGTDRAMRCARSRSWVSFSISVLSPFREQQFGRELRRYPERVQPRDGILAAQFYDL